MKASVMFFSKILIGCLVIFVVSQASPGMSADWLEEYEPGSVEERRILTTLMEKKQELRQEKDRLAKKEDELKILHREVEKRMEQLEKSRLKLEELLADKDEKERERVEQLSRIYQQMDPRRAAEALKNLDIDLAVDVVSGMRDGPAAKVLDSMDQEYAAALSEGLSRLEPN